MKVRDLLPIGSVVTLEGGTKRVMIYGIAQKLMDDEGHEVSYDYISVPYPEGNMGPEFQYMFNHDQIAQIHYEGFTDAEHQAFVEEFSDYLENLEEE